MQTNIETRSLETLPPSNRAAMTGLPFEDLNFQEIIGDCARRKASNGIGISYLSRKGKMTLFSGVAAAAKSQCGKSHLDKLSDDEVTRVNHEIALFWELTQKAILADGYVPTGVKLHTPKLEIDIDDKRVKDNYWQATQTYQKHSASDSLLRAITCQKQMVKQLDNMLANPHKYERAQIQVMRTKLEITADYIRQLELAKKVESVTAK